MALNWEAKPDTSLSNKFISGEYAIRYENTIYGYQYIIYKNNKQIGSCQTLDGAKEKAEKYFFNSMRIL